MLLCSCFHCDVTGKIFHFHLLNTESHFHSTRPERFYEMHKVGKCRKQLQREKVEVARPSLHRALPTLLREYLNLICSSFPMYFLSPINSLFLLSTTQTSGSKGRLIVPSICVCPFTTELGFNSHITLLVTAAVPKTLKKPPSPPRNSPFIYCFIASWRK